MSNLYNTPLQLFEANIDMGETKSELPLLKCILLGVLAGMFIAFGGAASSAAVHNIANQGLAKALAGCIFPVGLMMIVFVGGELFTGGCLMISGAISKKFTVLAMIKTLMIIYFSNMMGAVIIAVLVNFSGLLDYTNGVLGAFIIKTAYGKTTLEPLTAVCSGILCNILVCVAVLMAGASRDIVGKVWVIFFPIWAFVVGGWEHCVANMFYIPAGIIAAGNETYMAKAQELYGLTAEQIMTNVSFGGYAYNLLWVTIGNIIGGMLFVAIPLYLVHESEIKNKNR